MLILNELLNLPLLLFSDPHKPLPEQYRNKYLAKMLVTSKIN